MRKANAKAQSFVIASTVNRQSSSSSFSRNLIKKQSRRNPIGK